MRHCVRMFNAGANMTAPLFGVVVRKGYGLGVTGDVWGRARWSGFLTVAWPTAEFAGMNIEGEVKLGYRNELAAIEDPEERIAEYESRVARRYENAKAVNSAVGGGHRRRDRPGRHARLDRDEPQAPAAHAAPHREEVPLHRPLVGRPPMSISTASALP